MQYIFAFITKILKILRSLPPDPPLFLRGAMLPPYFVSSPIPRRIPSVSFPSQLNLGRISPKFARSQFLRLSPPLLQDPPDPRRGGGTWGGDLNLNYSQKHVFLKKIPKCYSLAAQKKLKTKLKGFMDFIELELFCKIDT